MPNGTVRWYSTTKGCGFIAPDAGGPDVYIDLGTLAQSGMVSLQVGQRLGFELGVAVGRVSAASVTAAD